MRGIVDGRMKRNAGTAVSKASILGYAERNTIESGGREKRADKTSVASS
jgi:hypothetical protein